MSSIQREPWRRGAAVLSVALLLPLAGCGVKAQLEECQTRLTATEAERARLDQDISALRDDYKEVLRTFAMEPAGDSVTSDLRGEVEQQIDVVKSSVADQVPPLVREQLEKELDSLLSTLDQQFGRIDTQYSRISNRLDEVRGTLDIANERLEGIEVSGQGLRQQISEQRIDTAKLEVEVEAIATAMENFDEARFLCRQCDAYLDIRPKRVEPILSFHADMRAALRRLPTRLAGLEAGFEHEETVDATDAEEEDADGP